MKTIFTYGVICGLSAISFGLDGRDPTSLLAAMWILFGMVKLYEK